MRVPYSLFNSSSRAARFTVSPSRVKLMRWPAPTEPPITLPVLMPIRVASATPWSPKVRLPTARWMSIAARTAAQAWSSQASGMLKEANRPSPMKVLTTPPWARIGSSTVSRYSFSAATSSSGARYSAMVVKPAMSVNRMVASPISPASTPSPWRRRMVAATLSST